MMSSFLSPPMSETTLEGCWLKELTLLLCCFHQKDDWRRNGVWQKLFLLYPSNPENKGRFFRHNLERLKEWRAIWDLGWKEQGSMLASVFCRSSSAAKTIDIFFSLRRIQFEKSNIFLWPRHWIESKEPAFCLQLLSVTHCAILEELLHPSAHLWNEVNIFYLFC